MNYQKYGQVIREIREQSNICLGSFSRIGYQKQTFLVLKEEKA